jgi:NADH-ubiquinone oxidoreductase chain 2
MSNAVNNRRDSSILYSRITILILINSLILLYNNFYINFLSSGIILYNGLLCIENYIIVFILFILLLSSIIISINSVFSLKKIEYINLKKIINLILNKKFLYDNTSDNKEKILIKNHMSEQYRIIEYPLIILFCIVGAIFLMSSFDIISIFLSIELQSYALYLICSIYRNSESSVSGGLTYFLLGGLSSCIILLGITLLYINSGTTNLENLYIINNISDIFAYNLLYINSTELFAGTVNSNNYLYNPELFSLVFSQYLYIQLSLVIMSVGFLFKISAAPFHF